MEEVTTEEQAKMQLLLGDKVRELIRDELKLALEDFQFVNTVGPWALSSRLFNGAASDTAFQIAVKYVIQNLMQRL